MYSCWPFCAGVTKDFSYRDVGRKWPSQPFRQVVARNAQTQVQRGSIPSVKRYLNDLSRCVATAGNKLLVLSWQSRINYLHIPSLICLASYTHAQVASQVWSVSSVKKADRVVPSPRASSVTEVSRCRCYGYRYILEKNKNFLQK